MSTLTWGNVELMSTFLYQLATELGLSDYCHSYALYNPLLLQQYINNHKKSSKQQYPMDCDEEGEGTVHIVNPNQTRSTVNS